MASEDLEKIRDDMINAFSENTRTLSENTAYYNAERRPQAISRQTPTNMREYLAQIGYARIYINSLADRLTVEGFRLGEKEETDELMWDWWQANNMDVESALAFTEALVHGRSYITVAAPTPDDLGVGQTIPIIRVESPTTLYAEIDPRTRLVKQAIRVIYDSDGSQVDAATLYLPDKNVFWLAEDGQLKSAGTANHGLGVCTVVPVANRTRMADLLGTSEITPEVRSASDAAARILMNMQGTADIMAVPQRLLFGVRPEELGVDPETGQALFDGYLARILAFSDHDAKAQQFSAAELRNFVDALDALDKKVAAYTGLPPQYLSTTTDNPASAEAIRASEARLVKAAERKALIFGGALEEAMRVAYKVMNPGSEIPPEMLRMETVWRDPSTPTYAAKADAATKLYANGLGVIPKEQARIDMGYSDTQRRQMRRWDEQEDPMRQLGTMYGTTAQGRPSPESQEDREAA